MLAYPHLPIDSAALIRSKYFRLSTFTGMESLDIHTYKKMWLLKFHTKYRYSKKPYYGKSWPIFFQFSAFRKLEVDISK